MTDPLVAPTSVHTATTVVPVAEPPIAGGAIAVVDGLVAAVGTREQLLFDHPGAELVEWDGVLTPGLVNAHTHLQYTSFSAVGADPFPTYVHWAERFVEEYVTRGVGEDWRATALDGIAAGLRAGTTCFADVVTDVVAMDVLVAADVAGVAYFEIIGGDIDRWEQGLREQVEHVLVTSPRTASARVGLSPHAPYSVTAHVIAESTAMARRLGLRIHSHLGEIDAEEELYRTGSGSWAERVRSQVGRPWPLLDDRGAGMDTADYARHVGLLGPDSHVAHGVYLGRRGRRVLADAGTYVALCPRSNLTVGSAAPPVADYLREGVPFAVGTDSLGSNRSLDLLEDVALLRHLAVEGGYDAPDLDRRLLAATTLGGAKAIGSELVGVLATGRRADFALFAVEPEVAGVERALTEHGAGTCIATFTAGERR